MKHGGENGAGHKVFDSAIGSGQRETLYVALSTLSVTGFAVFSLADASESSVPGDLNVVESAASHYFEFLPNSQGRNVANVFQSQKVRQRKEKPVLRGGLIGGLPGVLGILVLSSWWGLRRLSLRCCRIRSMCSLISAYL